MQGGNVVSLPGEVEQKRLAALAVHNLVTSTPATGSARTTTLAANGW
jgi:hypothetical protein